MKWLLPLLALAAGAVRAETPDEVARRYGLAGELLVAKGDRVLLDRGYGTVAPSGGVKHRAGETWRLASITKQVTAALLMAELARTNESIDAPLLDTVAPNLRGLTVRQLLTHHSGLPNPDSTPLSPAGTPAFYTRATPETGFCLSQPAKPGSAFAYNNCDYILIGTFLASDQRKRVWPIGMTMARAGETGVPGFVGGKPEPRFELASYGGAGGLIGTADAVFRFDRSLMTGRLLPFAALAELWKPEGNGSAQALGQWVFSGKLNGCAAPKRIVQRDGEIWGVQARNFILPDDNVVVIVFTNRSADDFAIGEGWQGKGFAYDLLSAAACGG